MTQENQVIIYKLKKLAAGPLGETQAKFPLRFAKAVFFGERPSRTKSTLIRNGTITLVDLGTGPIGVTCAHVIDGYRNLKKIQTNVVCQIGNFEIDPISHLIAEDKELDLATLRLSEKEVKAITGEGEIGSCVFKPVEWPSTAAQVGEGAVFGGFPEFLRVAPVFDELEFPSWSSGGSPVTTSCDDRFSCQFERDNWVCNFGSKHHMELTALSGLSGGPAFIHRNFHFDFVGIIYEFSPQYDLLFLRQARLLNADGSIG